MKLVGICHQIVKVVVGIDLGGGVPAAVPAPQMGIPVPGLEVGAMVRGVENDGAVIKAPFLQLGNEPPQVFIQTGALAQVVRVFLRGVAAQHIRGPPVAGVAAPVFRRNGGNGVVNDRRLVHFTVAGQVPFANAGRFIACFLQVQ